MRPVKTKATDVPLITDRGGTIRVLISPKTVESTQFILGISTLEVGGEIHNHIHDFSHEAFYVIQGEGLVLFEDNETIFFEQGDAVHIPKGVGHQIKNTGKEEIQVVFTASPLAPNPEMGHREL